MKLQKGGNKLRAIPYGHQSISASDVRAVTTSLRSKWLTCGPLTDEFEAAFAAVVGAKHAVVVNSGTSALHLAMRVADIGPRDRVITSPNTFLASANCAAFVGAIPDFSDIDPVSYNLSPEILETRWQSGTAAVVAVAYAGQPCDMPQVARIARQHGAIIIEDACHAVGSGFFYEGRHWKVGGHPWADLTVFSFHPVKTMTTAEGGMLVTDNSEYAAKARRLRSHGIERNHFVGLGVGDSLEFAERGPWYHEMQELGYNYRLTEMQAALGLSQLKHLTGFIARRREIVNHYNHAFAGLPWLKTPGVRDKNDAATIAWHLYTVTIDFKQIRKSRTQVMEELKERGVGSQVLYIPVHLQPWYASTYGYALGKCPEAERHYLRSLSLPLFPKMRDSDVKRVVEAVKQLV